jgi:hypothetical protein
VARKRALREEEEGERGEQERRGPAPSMGGRHGRRAAARMTRCWRSFALALLLLPLTSTVQTAVGTPGGSGQPREPGDANGSERVALFLRGASTNEKVLRRAAQTRRVRPGSCAGW